MATVTETSLEEIAKALVAPGKGILAATRATGRSRNASTRSASSRRRTTAAPTASCSSRPRAPRSSSAASSSSTRRFASRASDGTRSRVARDRGIIPGIKVDKGAKPLAGAPGETVTEGLDGLRERLAEYYELGARFTKWRAVISIDEEPTCPATTASGRTRTRWRASPRCRRRPASSRSSSPRC